MMLEDKFINEFVKMATKSRKISRPENLEKDIKYIFYSIEYFNSFDEYTYSLPDSRITQFSNIPVLNEFKDFVTPRSVRYEPSNLRTRDVLKRPSNPEGQSYNTGNVSKKPNGENQPIIETYKFSIDYYRDALENFRRHFKKDSNSDFVTLDSLKKHVSFNDIVSYIYVTDNDGSKFVKGGSSSFVPVALNIDVSNLFLDSYFTDSYETVLMDYMHKIVF